MRVQSLALLFAATACATANSNPSNSAPAWSFASTQPAASALLRTQWTPAELTAACDEAQKISDEKLAAVAAIPEPQRSFENTPEAIEQIETDWGDAISRYGFMKNVHTDAEVRKAAAACEEKSGKYSVQIAARRDLYLAMKGWQEGNGKSETLSAEQQRLVKLAMRDFHRAGLDLSDADREKLTALRSQISELESKFATALEEDSSSVELTKAELAGLPDSFIARLKPGKTAGTYIVTTQYPDYFPLMENGTNAEARKKLEFAFMNRAAGNSLLLDKAITLRDQAAHLLGYATHADYVADAQMAKTAAAIESFEAKLRQRLKPRLDAEMAKLAALKAAETGEKNATIYAWDWRYYLNQLRKRDFALDNDKIREYFPADKVMSGMLEVYAQLLSVKFVQVPNAQVWAPGVELYEIHDQTDNRLLARFYIDLFPRPGKYGHAASFPLGAARAVPGGYEIPLSVLVVNFSPPEGNQVAHLNIDEVDTLFHEFGHIMHQSLTTARYTSLAGSNVTRDFVEAPSQMLENFVFTPEVLAKVSSDPQNPGHPIPADLMKRLVAARRYDAGIRYSRQVFLGSFDLYIHTHGDKVDADEAARKLWLEIFGFSEPEGTHFAAGFGHLMGGYDAGYYGYLWSEVFSADMFTRFEKEGVLNAKTGREYRDAILARGRIVDPDALLFDFLGRAPNEDAFLKQLGLQ